MNRKKHDSLRSYAEIWQRAGPEIEAIRHKELADFDHTSNWRLIDSLLDAGLKFARPRPTSGLVEMQKWFMKLAGRRGLRPLSVRERKADYNRSKKPDKGRAPHEKV